MSNTTEKTSNSHPLIKKEHRNKVLITLFLLTALAGGGYWAVIAATSSSASIALGVHRGFVYASATVYALTESIDAWHTNTISCVVIIKAHHREEVCIGRWTVFGLGGIDGGLCCDSWLVVARDVWSPSDDKWAFGAQPREAYRYIGRY